MNNLITESDKDRIGIILDRLRIGYPRHPLYVKVSQAAVPYTDLEVPDAE
jgi:hypothetical protein